MSLAATESLRPSGGRIFLLKIHRSCEISRLTLSATMKLWTLRSWLWTAFSRLRAVIRHPVRRRWYRRVARSGRRGVEW